MLRRLSAVHPSRAPRTITTKRAYSYFSQRPGRFFTASKPGAASSSSKGGKHSASAVNVNSAANGSASPATGSDISTERTQTCSSSSGAPGSSDASSSSQNLARSPPSNPVPQFHPAPPFPSLHLHGFFAEHRPLLQLSQPLSALFHPPSVSISFTSPTTLSASTSEQQEHHSISIAEAIALGGTEEDAEADAAIARLLARSLVVQRIQAGRDWSAVMKHLGAPDMQAEDTARGVRDVIVEMDSVKRKRRKKMNKHKFKKRRKLQRAERRRLGK